MLTTNRSEGAKCNPVVLPLQILHSSGSINFVPFSTGFCCSFQSVFSASKDGTKGLVNMSESNVMEIYEIEVFGRNTGWVSPPKSPWIKKSTMEPCSPPEELALPSGEWCWYSNWRIDKQTGITDEDGWGYASRLSRLHNKNRRPKPEALFSRARRRLWSRVMRREASLKVVDMQKVLPGVQKGLVGVNAARIKIEEIMRADPEAAKNEQMVNLVLSVKRNIGDIVQSLDALEKQSNEAAPGKPNNSGIVKKLRNDVAREEVCKLCIIPLHFTLFMSLSQAAIDKALNPASNRSSKAFLPLRKQPSMNMDTNGGAAGGGNRTSFSIKSPTPPLVQFGRNSGNHSMLDSNSNCSSEIGNPFVMEVKPDLQKQSAAMSVPSSPVKKPQPKPIMQGGGKGTFDSHVFAQNAKSKYNGSENPDDGMFMDRTVQEQMIDRVSLFHFSLFILCLMCCLFVF
jgi:hypothetical protein